jgi:hypothetical protein
MFLLRCAALAGALAVLAGCGSEPDLSDVDPAERLQVALDTGYFAGDWSRGEAAFLLTLESFEIDYDTKADGVALGHEVCDFLDMDGGWHAALEMVRDPGLSERDAGRIVGGAIGTMCQRHADQIPG